MAFNPGNKTTFTDVTDHILDLKDGLTFLRPSGDGVNFIKRIGTNGFVAKSFKHEWNEVALAGRSETVTFADATGTSVDVADAYIYQVNDLVRVENEIVRVTALADADTLTVTRGYAGSTAAAHDAKTAINLGSADPENSDAPAGMADSSTRPYNYVQTFTRSVDLSNDEIAQAHNEGNPMVGQVKRRFIEWNQKLSSAVFYGVRYSDTSNKISVMGGLKQFVTTNPTSAGGALSLALIDAEIKQIVDAGGDPKVMVMGTTQKQKLDALDASLVRIGKKTRVGGNPDVQTWQSGILDHTIDIIVDPTILPSELWILDTDYIKVGPLSNNGVNGAVHVEDASTPGKDGKKRVIRGKYTMEVLNEKAHSYLYALTT